VKEEGMTPEEKKIYDRVGEAILRDRQEREEERERWRRYRRENGLHPHELPGGVICHCLQCEPRR
jgi:DNA polymerase IIIc chi subunit